VPRPLTKDGVGISDYESLKGKKTGSTQGTYEALALEADVNKWADPNGSFRAYQTQADVMLALQQGQIDATVVTSTVAAATIATGNYPGFVMGGVAPYNLDYVSLITLREEYGMINYLNLFVNQQIRTGRYKELYNKWIGEGDAPSLVVPNAYY